jgi:hypothetical protein
MITIKCVFNENLCKEKQFYCLMSNIFLAFLHHADVGNIADVSEVYALCNSEISAMLHTSIRCDNQRE